MRTLTYYVGVTLDGFIAAPDGSADFFPVDPELLGVLAAEYPETLPTQAREQLGVTAAGTRFDTVIMGRATYEPALQAGIVSPYAHLRQYVVSGSLRADPAVEVAADPVALVRRLKQEPGRGLWLAGGGRLAGSVLAEIDELVVKRYPLVLGAGIPMIVAGRPEPLPFTATDVRTLAGGATITTYARA